jgi:triacylglycerol esterase/lipase EstA (alpha/beta hydrolase family)
VEYVILVHGTGATAQSAEGEAWWQTGGTLWTRLAESQNDEIRAEAFIWSGKNSESERRAAARALALRAETLICEGHGVHLVGHSHGGSIIWHAIKCRSQDMI